MTDLNEARHRHADLTEELTEAIDTSYASVVAKLPKKDRPAEFSG